MPVKMPGAEALGGPSSLRSGRPVLTGADYGAGTVARGIQGVGAAVSAMSEEQAKQEDALDLIKADTEFQEGLAATRRSFETDPDYKTFGPRFDQAVSPLAEGAASKIRNPNSRAKWIERARGQASSSRESVLNRGLALEREHKEIEVENIVSRRAGDYASSRDPGERLAILNDTLDKIRAAEATGLIRPRTAERYRDQFVDGTIELDIEERLYSDPEGVLRDMGVVPGGKPLVLPKASPGPLPPQYIDEIKKSEGFTPRSSWDYKQHSIGYGTRGKPGETIDKVEADRRLNDELGKAAQIVDKFAPGLDEGTRAALVSLTFNAGDDWTRQGLGKAIKAGDMVKARSLFTEYKTAGGEVLPGLVARRQREAQWFGRSGSSDVERRELPPPGEEPDQAPDVIQFGEPETPDAEPPSPTRAQYAMMSGRRRQVMINKARIALSNITQQKLADDVARIAAGEPEERDENGRTAFDRASAILQPNVLSKWRTKRDQAMLVRDAVAPLDTMSEEEYREHYEKIGTDPATGKEREGIGFAIVQKARKAAEDKWEKVTAEREKDPYLAASKHPDAMRAVDMFRRRPMAVGVATAEIDQDDPSMPGIVSNDMAPERQRALRREVIEANLEAQDRLGVAFPRAISKEGAKRLLAIPKDASEDVFRDGLMAAARKAGDLYGPEMGERVFKDALYLNFPGSSREKYGEYLEEGRTVLSAQHKAEARASLLAKQMFGRPITDADMSRLRTQDRWLTEIDRIPSLTTAPERMRSDRPYIGQLGPQMRQPNERQSALLLQQIATAPDKAQKLREDFDAKFGDGAAARVINKLMNGEGGDGE
jgi:lysozyme